MVDRFVSWPTDVLRPTTSLQARLALRIAEETGKAAGAAAGAAVVRAGMGSRSRPGSNASCSRPTRNGTGSACWSASRPARATRRIRMPASKSCIFSMASCGSTSASSFPGDYNYGAPGAADERVWSETGCTCLLVTSTKDTVEPEMRRSHAHIDVPEHWRRPGAPSGHRASLGEVARCRPPPPVGVDALGRPTLRKLARRLLALEASERQSHELRLGSVCRLRKTASAALTPRGRGGISIAAFPRAGACQRGSSLAESCSCQCRWIT